MADLIDRQALIKALHTWDMQDAYLPVHFKRLIDEAPTVEPKKGEWISVDEKAPDFPCIAFRDNNYPYIPTGIVSIMEDGEWVFFDTDTYNLPDILDGEKVNFRNKANAITHWMPLPKPPSGADMRGEKE